MSETAYEKTKIISFRANLKIASDIKRLSYTLGISQTDFLKMAVRRLKHDWEQEEKL